MANAVKESYIGGRSGSDPIVSGENRIFKWERPPHFGDVLVAHLPLVIVSSIGLAVAFVPHLKELAIPLCTFKVFTGLPCPFCGFTVGLRALSAGNWAFALRDCPLAIVAYLAICLVFAWNMTGLLLRIRLTPGKLLQRTNPFRPRILALAAALILLNWIYRISIHLP